MPEAPEVHVVVEHLRPVLVGARIDRTRSLHHHFLAPPEQDVLSVHRHGKWIMVWNGCHVTQLHLGMSGSFHVGGPVHRHARWIAMVERGGERHLLQFVDPRCMGRVRVLDAWTSRMVMRPAAMAAGVAGIGLGPDAMSRYVVHMDAMRARPWWRQQLDVPLDIKPALMAQHVVAGLGNIYAS